MRFGDGARVGFAVRRRPGFPQPSRRVEPSGILLLNHGRAVMGQPPQHCVDQTLVRNETAHFGQIDRRGYRCVSGGAQEKQLRDAEAQHVVNRCRAGREGRLEAMADQHVDLAEATQAGTNQQSRESAVARGEIDDAGRLVDRIVKRPSAAQDIAENV